MAVASLLSVGVLGWVSRAPALVRQRVASAEAFDPAHGAEFSDAEIARHGAYRGPGYLYLLLSNVLTVIVLLLFARGPLARLIDLPAHVPEPT